MASVTYDDEGLPTSIRIFSVGENPDIRGEKAIYDPKNASTIMKGLTRKDGTVPFDVAHGMVNPDAPVALHEQYGEGTLRCDDTGVWVDNITWRKEMAKKLLDRAFRFISPTFFRDEETDMITDVLTISLTNIPATAEAEPIINEQRVENTIFNTGPKEGTKTMTTKKQTLIMKREDEDKLLVRAADDSSKELPDDEDSSGELPKDDDDETDSESLKKKDAADGDPKPEAKDEQLDLESVDLDSLTPTELRQVAEKLLDLAMDMKKELATKEEPVEDEEEAAEKREIVNSLFRDRLVKYSRKAEMGKLTLKEVRAEERALRKNQPAKKSVEVRDVSEKDYKPGFALITNNAVKEWRERNGYTKTGEEMAIEFASAITGVKTK